MDAEDFELACILLCIRMGKTFMIQTLVFFTTSAKVSSFLKGNAQLVQNTTFGL